MEYDRIAVKEAAKASIRAASHPSARMVTAVFILLTTGISFLQELFLPNPFYAVQETLKSLLEAGYDPTVAMGMAFQEMGKAALFVAIVLSLYNWVVGFGYTGYAMRIARNQHGETADLFDGFSMAGKVIVLELLQMLFIGLWSMLFVIPGLIAAYRYRLAIYLLIDNPELSPLEAIRQSKRYMVGYKMDLLVLDLSFFGWGVVGAMISEAIDWFLGFFHMSLGMVNVLSALIIGLAYYIWLTPYIECAGVNFYDCVTGRNQEQSREEFRGIDPWER